MANLGSAQTSKFSIGTAELRIGPLGSAGQLEQSHGVGIIDNATVSVSQNSVDLLGGFPQKIIDTAIISQESSLTATLREYSKRNIDVLLGNAISDYAAAVTTDSVTLDATSTAGTTLNLPLNEGANWVKGDIFVLHSITDPADVNVCMVESVAVDVLTLNTGTPTTFDAAIGDLLFRAEESAVGNISETNYFAVSLVQKQRVKQGNTSKPAVWNFWKGAISAGMEYSTSADDFGSTELAIKLLEPSAADYATGAALEHLASVIPSYPTGMFAAGADK